MQACGDKGYKGSWELISDINNLLVVFYSSCYTNTKDYISYHILNILYEYNISNFSLYQCFQLATFENSGPILK